MLQPLYAHARYCWLPVGQPSKRVHFGICRNQQRVGTDGFQAGHLTVNCGIGALMLSELHRLRGLFLAAIGADESQIDASSCEAIRTAKEQKSVSLAKSAEASYAEYRRQKGNR